MKWIKKIFSMLNLESLFWIISLVYLMIINPYLNAHFTLCPLKNLGYDFCPGCGIGKSISFLLHLDFLNSFKSHPLGIFALLVITNRTFFLIKNKYQIKKREV